MSGQRGFGFVELIVAMIIFSVGILGLFKLQMVSLHRDTQLVHRQIAQLQLANLTEQLRAHPTPTQIPLIIQHWNQNNARLLPLGHGQVQLTQHLATLTLTWGVNRSLSTQVIR